ncbi:hypothetical protein NCG89_00930 [Spongiibacter taiwanensis]|uniref:hypothetical protein n=1 Tax=Spongiibacter taiwanensis TaxID=1748242 RepID=UPI002035A244|nr:hypothetical protein [Spongiibacter taiwanensis]USA43367.1 hypothetical protein NCG89_00930 [Spongiibacter taiwanensis]
MSDEQHVQLLARLMVADGMVVISGYDSELYNDMLAGWEKHSTTARISAGRGTTTRTEVVWLNPACIENRAQQALF